MNATITKAKDADDDSAAKLQARLKAMGRNTGAFQQKVDLLFTMVDNCHKRRAKEVQDISSRDAQIAEFQGHYDTLELEHEKLTREIEFKREKRDRLRETTRIGAEGLSQLVKFVDATKKYTAYHNKATTSDLTTKSLSAQRGYSCKPGSTASHNPSNRTPLLEQSMFFTKN